MTFTEFLLARIAHDEAMAKQCIDGEWAPGSGGLYWVTDYGAEIGIDAWRVLAECEAKRRIVALWEEARHSAMLSGPAGGDESIIEEGALSEGLRLLASVYANHPDFDEAWRA